MFICISIRFFVHEDEEQVKESEFHYCSKTVNTNLTGQKFQKLYAKSSSY